MKPVRIAALPASPLSLGEGLPSRPGRPLYDMTLTKLLRDNGLGERCTVHGFQSSFQDWFPCVWADGARRGRRFAPGGLRFGRDLGLRLARRGQL